MKVVQGIIVYLIFTNVTIVIGAKKIILKIYIVTFHWYMKKIISEVLYKLLSLTTFIIELVIAKTT